MRSVLLTVVAALLIGATGSLAAPALEKDRDALWKIVHNICVRHWVSSDDPWPCTQIVASDAVVQDRMQDFVTHTQQLYLIGEAFQKLHRG